MSSIMRARSALPGRWEGWEVIGGSSPELKVAGPSMLGIGCPDRHAVPRITWSKMRQPRRALPSRASGSFFGAFQPIMAGVLKAGAARADSGGTGGLQTRRWREMD